MRKTLSRRFWFFGGLALALLVAALALLPCRRPSFPHANLVIERADGRRFSFDVKVAVTEDEKTHGLMFTQSLPADAGMLFLFEPPETVSVWMKDTPLSLDMLFVRADGSIAKIVTHTEPFSLATISAGEPVKGAIEINAGGADRRGIKTGDKVRYPGFGG